jgi:AcrR family transcriptional regulator
MKSIGRPKGINSEDTKRKILDAARICFAEAGYASTSNKDIADKAGITPGSIYHHFDNKADLFLSVHREMQEVVVARCKAAIDGQANLLDATLSLLDALADMHVSLPSYSSFNAVVRIEAARNPDIKVAREDQEWRDLYSQLAQLGVATGEIDAVDELAIRTVFATLILGLTHHSAEASAKAHEQAVRGVKLLLQGSLLKAPRIDDGK